MAEPQAKITLFDIETSPNLGWTWGKWQQNVIEFEQDWFMLSFSWKRLGEKKVHTHALPDYSNYKRSKTDDRALVTKLWEVLDDTDIVIGHNGDRFDVRKANTKFAIHRLGPPSWWENPKSIDTLKIARRNFKFESNKLDELGKSLGVGRKLPHTGKDLWLRCIAGDPTAWKTMRQYNEQDVLLLERVYLKLRAWHRTHPDLSLWSRIEACPKCQSLNLQQRGWRRNKNGKKQRLHCQDCGGWHS